MSCTRSEFVHTGLKLPGTRKYIGQLSKFFPYLISIIKGLPRCDYVSGFQEARGQVDIHICIEGEARGQVNAHCERMDTGKGARRVFVTDKTLLIRKQVELRERCRARCVLRALGTGARACKLAGTYLRWRACSSYVARLQGVLSPLLPQDYKTNNIEMKTEK
jgi:hypothetical protein